MNSRSKLGVVPSLASLLLLLAPLASPAKPPLPHYQFTVGETNVYSLEVTVQGENGQEVTTGNVFIATTAVSSNAATLEWHTDLRTENRNPGRPGMGYYGGGFMRGPYGFPRGAQIDLDDHGQVLRNAGDYPLAVPLGELVAFIFPPLPTKSSGSLATKDTAFVLDAPQLTGPVASFASQSPYGGGPWFGGFNARNALATLTVERQVTWQELSNSPAFVAYNKSIQLQSRLHTGGEARLTAQAEARLVFNLAAGRFDTLEGTGGLVSLTETTSQKSQITFACRRLTGADLAAALTPPPPPVVAPLSDADVQKLIADLKSDDDNTRRSAMSRLSGATITAPPAELMDLLATKVSDSDSFNRMTALNFLSQHATADQVPVLVKVLNDSDMSIRQNAIKALTRLHDPRAIGPLVEVIARGGNFNNISSDAGNALISEGPAAESAVLSLLDEKNVDTRRQACVILQQIGTRASLPALQKQMPDPDQQLSQAAVDAVRAINNR